jgi:hypothetical protein
VFFVPPGDIHYYRGLTLAAAGRPQEALDAFERYLADQKGGRYAKRAEAHLAELGAAAGARPVPRASWRVLAAATVHAEGAIGAPLIDATWKGRARALEPCFEGLPAIEPSTARVAVDVELDGAGAVKKAFPLLPAAWQEAAACVEDRLKELLRVPRPARPRPTTARLELVLAKRP